MNTWMHLNHLSIKWFPSGWRGSVRASKSDGEVLRPIDCKIRVLHFCHPQECNQPIFVIFLGLWRLPKFLWRVIDNIPNLSNRVLFDYEWSRQQRICFPRNQWINPRPQEGCSRKCLSVAASVIPGVKDLQMITEIRELCIFEMFSDSPSSGEIDRGMKTSLFSDPANRRNRFHRGQT
jgi:hypothetical protein